MNKTLPAHLRPLIALLAALAIASPAFLLSGCGKSGKTSSRSSSSSSASSDTAADTPPSPGSEGQSSIGFYNDFAAFRGVTESIFEKIDQAIRDGERFVTRDENGGRSSDAPKWGDVIPARSDIRKIPTLKFAAPADFSKANQNYINPRIKNVQQDTAALLKEIDTLKAYYHADDYKDDWHKTFLMARPRIESLMDRIAKNNKEVFKLADAISEETDRKNIAKSPTGVYILNMRDIINKAKDRADIILDGNFRDTRYGLGVPDAEKQQMIAKAAPAADKFDALTKEIDTLVAKYKDADRKAIAGTSAEKIYDGFFASYEKSIGDMKRIIRDFRERGYTNEQMNIERSVGELVRAHNEFLKARRSQPQS